ncbi:MAG: hypothetical protein ACRD8O_24080 [Bryobacteraceae bacterium]
MPFCSNCGAAVEGRYCPKCGTPMGAAGGETGPGASPSAGSAGLTDNVASALCYLLGLFTGIVFLLIAPYNKNRTIRFHAFQSIFLHLAVLAVSVFVFSALRFAWMLIPVFQLAMLALWLYLLYKTYQGQKIVLPVIGPLAEKQA